MGGESKTTDPLPEALISLPRCPVTHKKEGRQVLKHDALPPIPALTDGPATHANPVARLTRRLDHFLSLRILSMACN